MPRWLAGIFNLGLILQSPLTLVGGGQSRRWLPDKGIDAGDWEDSDDDILRSSTGPGEP